MMPPVDPNEATARAEESDVDPAAFLKSVRELSEKREREDNERFRRLEADVEKGRRERLARKAERARSISPEKPFPPSTAQTSRTQTRTPINASATRPPPPMTPTSSTRMNATEADKRSASPTKDVPEFKGFGSLKRSSTPSTPRSTQNSEQPDAAPRQSPSSALPARTGTLKWQQRPTSRGGASTPSSMASQESNGAHTRNTSMEGSQLSLEQIAASLGSRDPSWFRQTADRGLGYASSRRSKDSIPSENGSTVVSGRRGLPGLSRETSLEPGSTAPDSMTYDVPSKFGSTRDSGPLSSRMSTNTSISEPQKSITSSSDQASNMEIEQTALGRALTMSSSQARLAGMAERSSSPTKGMGGFVQSAMMKRSDSVSKRWSAQPGASLSRQNSTASASSGYGGLQGSYSMPKLEPTPSSSRETSNELLSRPSSSSSKLTNLALTGRDDKHVFVRPAIPDHNRSKSVASTYGTTADQDSATSPPSSPSKRFSPSKSSWIESALSKPESPRPASPSKSQPSWMESIARAKAQRGSAESTPRTGIPNPADNAPSGTSSPTKTTPFGQGLLKMSGSRDLRQDAATPQSITPPTKVKPPALASMPASPPTDTWPQTLKPKLEEPSTNKARPSTNLEQVEALKVEDNAPEKTVASPPASTARPKPETPVKPVTDFRSTLRSRPPQETKSEDEPEFLSKFNALRKAETEKYVAPDLLKNNILRGKAGLATTGGPQKRDRKDELKESLLAKKEQWKHDKEAGVVHERKTSGPPQTPTKPEALAKRELLGRSNSVKTATSPKKPKNETPEALRRQESLKGKPKDESLPAKPVKASPLPPQEGPRTQPMGKQISASASTAARPPTETRKLAARFNPGLAGILARGPPPALGEDKAAGLRSDGPTLTSRSTAPLSDGTSEPPAESVQLQDVRKGRAKGPKRRRPAGNGGPIDSQTEPVCEGSVDPMLASLALEKPTNEVPTPQSPSMVSKPGPKSAASIMAASYGKPAQDNERKTVTETSFAPAKDSPLSAEPPAVESDLLSMTKPSTAVNSSIFTKSTPTMDQPNHKPATTRMDDVSGFDGFGAKASRPAEDENKENTNSSLPSVKDAATMWGRPAASKAAKRPSQVQLPNKKDEEAAMWSAGLLASTPSRPSSSNGLGISVDKMNGQPAMRPLSTGLPPKPSKPSRVANGQLQESSNNKGLPSLPLNSESERLLYDTFGSVPTVTCALAIDTRALMVRATSEEDAVRTLRKTGHEVSPDGSLTQLPAQAEYTLFDESVYLFVHTSITGNIVKRSDIVLWAGSLAAGSTIDAAQVAGKRLSRESNSTLLPVVRQGRESASFFTTLGGILVTRRGTRDCSPKQYMLCGRKQLGHIAFDEVDFAVDSLCCGFAYLISYPVTLQETKLYLWKGSACSPDELSAARLAAMDLSETGEIIEVDDGAEFASFLKVFGKGTVMDSVPKPTETWQQKASAPDKSALHLFRVQLVEIKAGLFTSMFSRRPSWKGRPPLRQDSEVKVEAVEITPFMQADLEADGIYLLDGYGQLYILLGPLFTSQPEISRNMLLGQILLFASDYANLAASLNNLPSKPKCSIIFHGVPKDIKMLFRHWDDRNGLWATAGLMAGSKASQDDVSMLSLHEVLPVVCQG